MRSYGTDYKRGRFAAAIAWLDTNKPFLAKITYASLFLTYLIGIPAWPAISTWLSLDKEMGVTLVIGVFIAHLGLILTLVVDIYSKVLPAETWFQSHQEALPTIRELLNAALHERPCKIIWIGVSMQSAWLALENVFRNIEEAAASEVKVTLLLINPDYLRTLPGENDGLAKATEGQIEYMTTRCQAMNQALLSTNSEITLAQYSHMPNFHGPLIGDNTLFLSAVRWHGDGYKELSVPREPNELLTSSTNRGRYSIKLYNSWLEKGLISARADERIFHYPLPPPLQNPAASTDSTGLRQ